MLICVRRLVASDKGTQTEFFSWSTGIFRQDNTNHHESQREKITDTHMCTVTLIHIQIILK